MQYKKISIDDNLESLLNVSENSKMLIVSISKNENNKRYIENSNIKIVISVLALSGGFHNTNSEAILHG